MRDLTYLKHPQKRLCNNRSQIPNFYKVGLDFKFEGEIFKRILNYRDVYISRTGKVVRLTVYGVRQYKITNSRYPLVSIRRKNKMIHRLLAQTFIPNPYNLPCVNHKNGNRKDYSLSNLEWVTYSDNSKHVYNVIKRMPPHTKLIPLEVKRIMLLYKNGVEPEILAQSFEVSIHVIRDILKQKRVQAKKLAKEIGLGPAIEIEVDSEQY